MNIIANAIDALEESNNGRCFNEIEDNPNHVTITTLLEESWVKIIIADNGMGMSDPRLLKEVGDLFWEY